MRKLFFSFVLVFCNLTLSTFSSAYATEPPNLQDAKTAVVNYYNSGEYVQDINHVVNDTMKYMKTRINNNDLAANAKLAIVLDIDDTSLSGYSRLKDLGFGGNIELWHAGEMQGKDPSIPAVYCLYHFATQHNVAVFFITGRTEKEQPATEQNLKNAGYTNWTKIYFKPENYNDTHKSASFYKTEVRKQIEKDGYDIIVNIGDQESDLSGGYADKDFKLPNPFYRIP